MKTHLWFGLRVRKAIQTLFIIVSAACGGAALAQTYNVINLDTLGGVVNRGNSINNRGWVAGYANLPGDQSRHAALWRNGTAIEDLGTLGGPNSNVTWNTKNNRGVIVGIAQTDTPDPLGEYWSSAAFFPAPDNIGFICLGFRWENGVMTALPTLGGNNGFATCANNHGQIVGWTETTSPDSTCVPPQVLQFLPVIWGPRANAIHKLPLISGDTSGAATAINDPGQVVGISGICDQAIGRYTATHAVLWQDGTVTDLGNLGALWWNTPTAVNQRGDIVGFLGDPGFPEGDVVHAFKWNKKTGIQELHALPGHTYSEADGINEHRQIVGTSCDPDFVDCRAVIWENGAEATDLNTLIPSTYTNRLENGKDINLSGEITGRSIDPVTGARTPILLVPVP